ncbi:MAG: YggN family protein [Colwellia sp.]|nr:YggN family protein [Colwellia sp.]MCW8866379.1 YggN family protein [Colwellia sp.]MCW9080893.1 YggN family protein [Colwellia sp.]
MMPKTLLTFFVLCFFASFHSQAKQCSVNLNYGVIIDPSHIRIIDHGKTIIQINGSTQLFIEGREVKLDNEQQQLIEEFSSGIRRQIPEIVSIAIEGVDIGLKAVNKVIGGLTGENSASQQKVQTKFDELKWRVRTRFNQSANNYYIAPQDFDEFDDIFTGEFEQEIEEIISDSIGTILLAVGEAMINNSDNDNPRNTEQRISTFDERIESMGKDLELEITASAKVLEKKAAQFCLQMVELNDIETKMHKSISSLNRFNLIETN